MTGPGARRHRREGNGVRGQPARAQVEIQDVDLVGAQVDAEYVLGVQVGQDLVRVRAFLPVGFGPVPLPSLANSSVMAPIDPLDSIRKTGKSPLV